VDKIEIEKAIAVKKNLDIFIISNQCRCIDQSWPKDEEILHASLYGLNVIDYFIEMYFAYYSGSHKHTQLAKKKQ